MLVAVVDTGKCTAKVDLGFLLDVSGSIELSGRGNFKRCIDFIVQMVDAFIIGPSASHVGLVKYSHIANVEFDFKTFTDKQSVIMQVLATRYPGGGTLTGKALTLCLTNLFNTARKELPNILIVMTDGESYDDVGPPSKALRDSGVIIYSLGIGKNFNVKDLEKMASDPKSEHVMTADFKELSGVIQQIKNKACTCKWLNEILI